MSGMDLDLLPRPVPEACSGLAEALTGILGDELVALWTYGAAAFPDPPRRLDVDTHAVLAREPDAGVAQRIDEAHAAIAAEWRVDWDSWYVLAEEARGSRPPRHVLASGPVDTSWALHRAHWLAGRYALVHGAPPETLVTPPTWPELEEALAHELGFIEQLVAEGRLDALHASFSVWNGCRVLQSVETRDVVISKRMAARWGLEHLPARWHAAILAAGRAYDDERDPDDARLLVEAMVPFVRFVRERSALPVVRL